MVRRGRIVNQAGQQVILRGFNDDSLLQIGSRGLPPPLSAADAATMEAQGFDVVRIPISWSLLEPSPGHFSATYLHRIEALVGLCARHHLYTVLDMHTEDFGVGFGGSGAPPWLYVPLVPDWHLPLLASAWQRHASPAVNAALAFFWLYPNWQRVYWQAWTYVARAFAGNSAVAAYDLYNEPHPVPIPPGIFATHLLWPFYAAGLRTIARVDPNHIFVVEGNLFGDFPTAVRPLRAPDLVYSTHLYQGSLIGDHFSGNVAPLRSELRQGLEEAARLPAPYWTGELGIRHNSPDASGWARAEIALSDQHLTGWAWWQWDDGGGWGVRNGGGPVDRSWLRVLSQPYVQAAAGELERMAFDVKARTLTVTVRSPRPGVRLQLAWPESLGTPKLEGGCAIASGGYRPGTGRISVALAAGRCTFKVRAD